MLSIIHGMQSCIANESPIKGDVRSELCSVPVVEWSTFRDFSLPGNEHNIFFMEKFDYMLEFDDVPCATLASAPIFIELFSLFDQLSSNLHYTMILRIIFLQLLSIIL